jgi:hypothetical protein
VKSGLCTVKEKRSYIYKLQPKEENFGTVWGPAPTVAQLAHR